MANSFHRFISFIFIIGLLNHNCIIILEEKEHHEFKERQLTFGVDILIIGLTFFALTGLAVFFQKQYWNKNKDFNKRMMEIQQQQEGTSFQYKLITFFAGSFTKDLRNRCYVTVLRDNTQSNENMSYLKHICRRWANYAGENVFLSEGLLNTEMALAMFEIYLEHRPTDGSEPFDIEDGPKVINEYFIDLMAKEVIRSTKSEKVDTEIRNISRQIKQSQKNISEQSLNMNDFEIIEMVDIDEANIQINESNLLTATSEPSEIEISLNESNPKENKVKKLLDNNRPQVVNSEGDKEDVEVEEDDLMWVKGEDIRKELRNEEYDSVMNFKLINKFYKPFLFIILNDLFDDKEGFNKYKVEAFE